MEYTNEELIKKAVDIVLAYERDSTFFMSQHQPGTARACKDQADYFRAIAQRLRQYDDLLRLTFKQAEEG